MRTLLLIPLIAASLADGGTQPHLCQSSMPKLESKSAESNHSRLPEFDDYTVKDEFEGKPAVPHIATKEARLYRSTIKEQSATGPNFAGHYTIVVIGCGAACAQFAVVDARTGDVFFQPFNLVYGAEDQRELQEKYDPQYRLNSKLLVVFGSIKTKGNGIFFYKWEDNRFKLVHSSLKKD